MQKEWKYNTVLHSQYLHRVLNSGTPYSKYIFLGIYVRLSRSILNITTDRIAGCLFHVDTLVINLEINKPPLVLNKKGTEKSSQTMTTINLPIKLIAINTLK